jgi:hypothetical protein
VRENFRIGAARVFEGVSENGHASKGTFVVDGLSELGDRRSEPGWIKRHGLEWVTEDLMCENRSSGSRTDVDSPPPAHREYSAEEKTQKTCLVRARTEAIRCVGRRVALQ